MLDSTALPQAHDRTAQQTPAGRMVFSPQAWQALLIVLGIAVATFVLSLYVLPNSQIDAARVRIAELQAEKAAWERENAALLQEIASASNLKTLEIRAKALGMGPARSAIYLQLPDSDSALAAATSSATTVPDPESTPATLAEWLQRQHLQERLREFRLSVSQAVERVIQRFQGP